MLFIFFYYYFFQINVAVQCLSTDFSSQKGVKVINLKQIHNILNNHIGSVNVQLSLIVNYWFILSMR